MRRLAIVPDGWPCTFDECPPGFFVFKEDLFLKSEYGNNEAFCCSGEYFCGGAKSPEEVAQLIVQPVTYQWEEIDV